MPSRANAEGNVYLGDGVYASHDGYQIWLAVNDHENKVIALEPDVFERLIVYANYIRRQEADDAAKP